MVEDVGLSKWIEERIQQFDGKRIKRSGRRGQFDPVKLELKEVQISLGEPKWLPDGKSVRHDSATITFVPGSVEFSDEVEGLIDRLRQAEASGSRADTIGALWEEILDSVGDDCNVIPSARTDTCREKLVVFPEMVSILHRSGKLPNPFEFCRAPQDALRDPVVGICCALCEATKAATLCFSDHNGWMNRVIDIRGDYDRIRSARSLTPDGIPICSNIWLMDDAVDLRDGVGVRSTDTLPSETPHPITQGDITCWNYFLGAMRRLRNQPGAPLGFPRVFLDGHRARF